MNYYIKNALSEQQRRYTYDMYDGKTFFYVAAGQIHVI